MGRERFYWLFEKVRTPNCPLYKNGNRSATKTLIFTMAFTHKYTAAVLVLILACWGRCVVSVPTLPTNMIPQGEADQDPTIPILDIPTLPSDPNPIHQNGLSKDDRMKKLDEKLGRVLYNYHKHPPTKRKAHVVAETDYSQTWSFLNHSIAASSFAIQRNSYCSSPSTEWYSESGLLYSIINKAIRTVLYDFDIPSTFVQDTEKFLDWIVNQFLHMCNVPSSFCLATNGDGSYALQGISTNGYSECFYVSDLQLVICPAVSWTWDTWYQDVECAYENQFCVGYIDLGVRVFDLEWRAGGMVQAHIGESATTAAEGSVLIKNFCANVFYE